jgi:hypothetical protein
MNCELATQKCYQCGGDLERIRVYLTEDVTLCTRCALGRITGPNRAGVSRIVETLLTSDLGALRAMCRLFTMGVGLSFLMYAPFRVLAYVGGVSVLEVLAGFACFSMILLPLSMLGGLVSTLGARSRTPRSIVLADDAVTVIWHHDEIERQSLQAVRWFFGNSRSDAIGLYLRRRRAVVVELPGRRRVACGLEEAGPDLWAACLQQSGADLFQRRRV